MDWVRGDRVPAKLKSMDWVRGDRVGQGSFATVSLAIPKWQSHQIPPLMVVKSCEVSQSASLLNEKSILDQLNDCPQIIQCFGDNFSIENGENLYNMLLEYAPGRTLADKLQNFGNRGLPEYDIRRYAMCILKGLHYIHEKRYVHCDIKLQNCLLFSCKHGGDDVAKIADFGLAKKAEMKNDQVGFEMRGTPLYMSPETVACGEQESPADIWALGCVVAEMVTGKPAWMCRADCCVGQLLLRIGVGNELPKIPENLSEEGKDFLAKCFIKDPKERWTAEMLLNHHFITNHDNETSSISSTNPFDFTDGVYLPYSLTSLITSLPLLETSTVSRPQERYVVIDEERHVEKVRHLATNEAPDWSMLESWVTVR